MSARARPVRGRLRAPAWVLVGALLITGCAYRLGTVAAVDYQSVCVPMFRNRTVSPQLEAQVTNALIKRLHHDGGLRVENRETAHVLVDGEIIRYQRSVLRTERSDTSQPREYRLQLTARVSARDVRTGEWVFPPTEFTGQADAFIGSDLQSADYQALPLIADDLARQIVTQLTERWEP